MSKMDYAAMAEFLNRPLVAVYVTLRADGSPHAAPVWFEFVDGEFRVFTSDTFQRVRNLERDSRAAITISTHDEPYAYVSAEGLVSITREGLEETARSISWRYMPEGAEEYLAELLDEHSVVLRLTPERILTWVEG